MDKHYANCGLAFEKVSIYKYFRFVYIAKQSQQQTIDYKFDNEHGEKEWFVQRPL